MTREQSAFFESFFRERYQSLVVYAYRYLKNWDDAREATQEAFLTGFLKIDQFYGSESHIGWIKETIRKKARNMTHARQRHAFASLPFESAEARHFTCDHYSGVDSPLAHCAELLSMKEFSLLKRVFVDGDSYASAAAELGIAEAACRKRMERIFVKLRKKWEVEK